MIGAFFVMTDKIKNDSFHYSYMNILLTSLFVYPLLRGGVSKRLRKMAIRTCV